jgi:toxin ParE1/3/4
VATVFLTKLAQQDLQEIWDFLSSEAGNDIADQVVLGLQSACDEIAAFPEAGRSREGIRPGLRSFVTRPYVCFYRPGEDGIEVIRILHSARDIDSLFRQLKY